MQSSLHFVREIVGGLLVMMGFGGWLGGIICFLFGLLALLDGQSAFLLLGGVTAFALSFPASRIGKKIING